MTSSLQLPPVRTTGRCPAAHTMTGGGGGGIVAELPFVFFPPRIARCRPALRTSRRWADDLSSKSRQVEMPGCAKMGPLESFGSGPSREREKPNVSVTRACTTMYVRVDSTHRILWRRLVFIRAWTEGLSPPQTRRRADAERNQSSYVAASSGPRGFLILFFFPFSDESSGLRE